MADGTFATSISCMDGRIQTPISEWIKENFQVDFVDTITEPGVDKVLVENPDNESIKNKVSISINAHKSKLVVVSGHYECAANPISDEEHISQIKKDVEAISSWNLGVEVVGIWVDNSWKVNRL